jgi:hypothetical protein
MACPLSQPHTTASLYLDWALRQHGVQAKIAAVAGPRIGEEREVYHMRFQHLRTHTQAAHSAVQTVPMHTHMGATARWKRGTHQQRPELGRSRAGCAQQRAGKRGRLRSNAAEAAAQ